MALRTAAMGLSPAKNLRAVSFRICWLSLSPNCIVVLLFSTQQSAFSPEAISFTAKIAKGRKGKKKAMGGNFVGLLKLCSHLIESFALRSLRPLRFMLWLSAE